LVPVLVVTSLGLVASSPAEAAPPPGGAHFFVTGEDGLIVNRRPSNVSFLATGKDVYLAEDTLEATAGYDGVDGDDDVSDDFDQGFLAQPEPGTMQATRRIHQWPDADSVP
jgi:hypothetical protein